jgi:hypothetical protein
MPRQPDMFTPALTLHPPVGADCPRLWVRRLTIWSEPAAEPLRDIALRPGLNIVWSPDGTRAEDGSAVDGAMGHGSGKTLFCRLVRYCLGEERFAPEDQRQQIATAFPNGFVGAEIVLDSVPWAVVRPLGLRRRHMAVEHGDLNRIAAGDGTHTGLEPFLDAVEDAILTRDVADLIPGHRQERRAWPIALAWLTRDQECRFDGVLDWRSRASDSNSAARGLNETEKLDALRAFLRAITVEEQIQRRTIAEQEARRSALDGELGHRQWEIDRLRRGLAEALEVADDGLIDMPLAIDLLHKAANERLAAAGQVPTRHGATDISAARAEHEAVRAEVDRLNREISRLDTEIEVIPRLISQIRGEIPGLSAARNTAAQPVCPICEVPIDRALAEGCGLSSRIPDLAACLQRFENRQRDLAKEEQRLAAARTERHRALADLAIAKQTGEQAANRLRSIEQAREERHDAWYSARRLVDRVARLARLIQQQDEARRELRQFTDRIEASRRVTGTMRDQQGRVIGRIGERFDAIIRHVVGRVGQGRVALIGNHLDLRVLRDGDRSTAAIDSLKVIAFDLAALCLSVEGETRVPAFLIHDSPREADLGLPLYHRLFQGVRLLEQACGAVPLFQYIVTTTTPPPPDLTCDPWLRLTLHGVPASERLLGRDL